MARRRRPEAFGGPHNKRPVKTTMYQLGHRRARRAKCGQLALLAVGGRCQCEVMEE